MKSKFQACYLPILAHYAAKSDIRYYLNGFLVEPAPDEIGGCYLVATNGHHMVVIHDTKATSDDRIIYEVPRRMLADCKLHKGKATYYAGDKFIELDGTWATLEDNTGPIRGERCKPIDGKYPQFRKVLPKSKKATESICINQQYIADIHDAMKKSGIHSKINSMHIELNGPQTSISVFPVLPDDHRVMFIIMLMRNDPHGSDALWFRNIDKEWVKPLPPVEIPADFTPWAGGQMPVTGMVSYIKRSGNSGIAHSTMLEWDCSGLPYDVVAYRDAFAEPVAPAGAFQVTADANGWIQHTGSECPVADDTELNIRFIDEEDSNIEVKAQHVNWSTVGYGRIAYYRIVRHPAPVGIDSAGGAHD